MSTFTVQIPNLPKLQEAVAQYPAIATPILQNAVVAAQAMLAKYTTPNTVPVLTGYLMQNWGFSIGNLQASWYPKAAYASFVEFGTAPHVIKAVNKKVLANAKTGQVFGREVHHPGTKANPFLERIMAASQPDITDLFIQALEKITTAISTQST